MKISYVPMNFSRSSLTVIDLANEILREYAAEDLDLTLRQLYYQFVARGLLPNKQTAYKRLGSIVSNARLAGLIDWERIEDRTRFLRALDNWTDPGDIITDARGWYRLDHWRGQDWQPEVWIEKDALVGVIEKTCQDLDVPFFACRGYVSQSEMWRAAQRLIGYTESGRKPWIFHLGDHDPSGVDMTRDITDRLLMFGVDFNFERIALNMDQIEEYNPPPNPAKITDSRAASYITKYGHESWELDALEPRVLRNLIRDHVKPLRDEDLFDEVLAEEKRGKETLGRVVENWTEL